MPLFIPVYYIEYDYVLYIGDLHNMQEILKKFIERHIQMIEKEDWENLYYFARMEIPFQIGNLSCNLIQAGINPLDKLDRVLPEMFCEAQILHNIELPSNIKSIKNQAFKNCYELKQIILPQALSYISETAFEGCYELEDIQYKGTASQLMDISITNLFVDTKGQAIKCSNGVLIFHDDGTVEFEGI